MQMIEKRLSIGFWLSLVQQDGGMSFKNKSRLLR